MKGFWLGVLCTLLVLAVGGYGVLKAGMVPVGADVEPGWMEKTLAHLALESRLEKEVKGMDVPMTATHDVLLSGMKGYLQNCAGCHGSLVHTDATFAKSLNPHAPQFGPRGLKDPIQEIFWLTKHGIRMSGMPSFGTMLNDDQIWHIAIFLANVKSLPEDLQRTWENPKSLQN